MLLLLLLMLIVIMERCAIASAYIHTYTHYALPPLPSPVLNFVGSIETT